MDAVIGSMAAALVLLPRPWLAPGPRDVIPTGVFDWVDGERLTGEFLYRGTDDAVYVKGEIRRGQRFIRFVPYWHRIATT